MLRSCGVIVEYNPLHNGHRYHLKLAREKSQADIIIAVMSGNFLQRGEPAIIDKWNRANLALHNGADLVIELPFAYAVQSADYFAKGAIQLLQALNCHALCFGTDVVSKVDYEGFAEFTRKNQRQIQEEFQALKNNGMSYPQQMKLVFQKLLPQWQVDLTSPNHILGMSYAKENILYTKPMQLIAIQRKISGYHDEKIHKSGFASATAIRKELFSSNEADISHTVPELSRALLSNQPLVQWSNYWKYLRYQLILQSPEHLAKIYQMTEGLNYRMLQSIKSAGNFLEFISSLKTKRYTWTRMQRLTTYLLTNVTEEEVHQAWSKPYIRVLGFNNQGQKFLKQQKKQCMLPIITNTNRENESLLELDIRVGRIYQLASTKIKAQDYYRKPIIVKDEL